MSDELKKKEVSANPELLSSSLAAGDTVGQLLAQQYRIDALIGKGGMSAVYRCTDLALNRVVALKLLNPVLAVDEKQAMRFQQEGRLLNRLSHAHVVKVHHLGVLENGCPYLVMEFIEGISLSQLIEGGGKLGLSRTQHIIEQVVDALAHAHSQGIVHRDLKPSNIMLTRSDQGDDFIKIVDFGIAKLLSEEAFQKLTATGDIFGSPLYMSPEQCAGLSVDHRTDIYSLGCIIYECLTGSPPFVGSSSLATMMHHQQNQPLTLREATLGDKFPEEIENAVARMLAKQPECRYCSVQDVVAALKVMPTSPPVSLPKVSSKPGNSRQIAIVFALLVAAIVGVATCCFYNREPAKQTSTAPPADVDLVPDPDVLSLSRAAEESAQRSMPDPYVFAAHNGSGVALWITRVPFSPPTSFMDSLSSEPQTAQLEFLDLSHSNVSDADLKALINLPLRAIVLRSIRGLRNLEGLAYIPSLRKLDLLGTGVDDQALQKLNPNLVELNLGECKITNETLQKLAQLKHLRRLFLWGDSPPLNDSSIKLLHALKSLEYLGLRGNQFSEQSLSELIERLPNCSIETRPIPESVCLFKSPKALSLDDLGNPRLRCINVNENEEFNEARLKEIEHLPRLYSLWAGSTALKRSSVHYLNPHLMHLGLNHVKIGDQGVKYIQAHLRKIRKLLLADTDISDAALKYIAAMKDLDEVNIRFNSQLTLKGVRKLLAERPDMVVEADDKLR